MRHFIVASGLAALLACSVQAQTTNPAFTPGKIVVLRGGDGLITISSGRQHPIFIDEYDPAIAHQAAPLLSVELPTNGPNAIIMNAHAGSEGQYMTRSSDRRYLTVSSYCGALNSIPGTPSSATNASNPEGYPRGFGLIDAFTNWGITYASTEWFGLPPGVSQDNPRGIATDGSNDFWGCGTVAGNQTGGAVEETGTLFWNSSESPDPGGIQNQVESAYFLRIINNTLYMVGENESGGAQENGIFTFQEFDVFGGAPVPLPWIPGSPTEGDTLTTNVFLNAGPNYSNIKTFDMNPQGTVAYIADTALGIAKFVNSGGTWTQAYLFNSNNIGSGVNGLNEPKGATGCYGIAVDFSGANPIIYATTMDEGDGKNTCSNRLISIVDTGTAPGNTNVVCTTLATASNINEVFRGVDFAPDLEPAITQQPLPVNTTTNQTFSLTVGTQSVYPLTYQWQVNGTNVNNTATISGSTTGALTISAASVTNDGNYTVIVSNQYGAVTSSIANVFVSPVAVLPSITNAVVYVTNFIGNNQSFSVNPGGTPPFTYQWYQGNTALSDSDDSGDKYGGSTNSALTITNLQLSDSGSYSIAVTNQAGGIVDLVAVLTVQYVLPSIPSVGQPASPTVLQGQTVTLAVSDVQGTAPLSYQWYQVLGNTTNQLSDRGEFSGTTSSNLVITGATLSDAASYYCYVSNAGGNTNSQKGALTVLVPPAPSFVAYSNQIYFQNFDSLPNPGTNAVNTVGGGGLTTIGGINYDVADPFDFAFPLYTNISMPSGGLNLAATMPGWYGFCDGDTAASGGQLGAADGSTTTGGIYSFGTLTGNTGNRALGLIATSTSGGSHFGLKLINETASPLNYISMQFTGEFWKTGTKPKTMVFSYNVDSSGNSSTLNTPELTAASNNVLSLLTFSFPTAGVVGGTNGTLPQNQTNLAVTNLALATPWQPGSALWLIWSINDATGSGQGYGIDNLSFYSSTTNVLTPAQRFPIGGVTYSTVNGLSFGFNSAPGYSSQLSVRSTTNVDLPLSLWKVLGHPTEASFGAYQFTDGAASTNAQTFYTVTSP